jgi:signal transduction histidine kinase/DNA-binding response OmpR family regulator
MGNTPILIVEDDAIIAENIRRKLASAGYIIPDLVMSGEEAIEKVGEMRPGLVLMDIGLSGKIDGVEAARQIRNHFDIPVVYLTAHTDEATLQRAKITEPFGYLLKPFNERELQAIIETALYKHQMEKTLRRRNRELALLNQAGQAFNSSLDLDQVLVTVLEEMRRLLDVLACSIWLVAPETGELVCRHATGPKGNDVCGWRLEPGVGIAQWTVQNGQSVMVPDAWNDERHCLDVEQETGLGLRSILSVPLQVKEQIIGVLQAADTEVDRFTADDLALLEPLAAAAAIAIENARLFAQAQQEITERKQAELAKEKLQSQLLQAQKMEAIGRLTAGIAHDFNNLLTAINGFAELLQHRMPADNPYQKMVNQIAASGQRAADLVRQLLVFSRPQAVETSPLNLNAVIAELDKMLRRIIGEDIEIALSLGPDLWPVKIDPAKLEQVIINLAVNARDAMPQGGKLTLETTNVTLEQEQARQFLDLTAGNYVQLQVSDQGKGMTDEIKTRIFEPFFTTKERDHGTGLGLATCYGIVKQFNGHITVDSQPQQGTTFTIYLPQATSAENDAPPPADESELQSLQGTETILLVEDEMAVRVLVASVLTDLGYKLIEATDGREALQMAQEYDDKIDLLLTDMVMPQMGGKELAEQLQRLAPHLKVIFVSGYIDDSFKNDGQLDPDINFVQKPFSLGNLVRKVRAVLDQQA